MPAVNFTYCARFYYTNDWIFDYDTRMAQKIYEDLRTVRAENGLEDGYDNILFLGYPDVPYNAVCMKGDIIGSSLFQYGYEQKGPVRVRIEKFMKNIGYPLPTYYAEGEIAAFHYYFDDVFRRNSGRHAFVPTDRLHAVSFRQRNRSELSCHKAWW